MGVVRLVAVISLVACIGLAMADPGLIRLSMNPSLSVADGRSTVTVSAEVRDSGGRAAKDGTQVVFATTLGNFREEVVSVYGGFARAILVAGSIPGIAKVSATAIALNAVTVQEFEFVADRNLLSAAREFIEVDSPQTLTYNVDLRTMGASAPNQGVLLRFRDIEVHADDLQVNVPLYEVRARKATVRMGKTTARFDEVYLALNSRKGFGTTTFDSVSYPIAPFGSAVRFVPTTRRRYGLAEIRTTGISDPTETVDAQRLKFVDISDATSMIHAKSAIAFPRKEIQFHHADVVVGGAKIMKVPLYNLSMSSSVVVTEQILNVNNNQIAVNYPYYLSLKPGFTSLFRFRTGESYGRGFTANRGAFLDYEMAWNRGDNMDGGLTVSGIGREDWGLGIRQSLRPDDKTYAYLQGDLTGGRSLFGSFGLSRALPGMSLSLNGSSSHSLTGLSYSNEQVGLNLEKDPTKVGRLPVRLYYGLTATVADSTALNYRVKQAGVGLRARMQMTPQYLDKQTTISASLAASSLAGSSSYGTLGLLGTVTLSRSLGGSSSAMLSYDFADDGYSGLLLGKHRLNLQMFYGGGRTSFTGMIMHSLDIKRDSYLLDASYRLSNLWRLASYFTLDSYLGQSFEDYSFVISYRLGVRDVGLVYSGLKKRIGIQILGASFN